MKRVREKLMGHILMVVAPLLVLLMITVAWFVNSRTINLSEMSFATQDSGPGAVIYPVKTLGKRNYNTDAIPSPVLSYDSIVWGEKLAPEDSDITIENMLPGQCEYYLFVSDKKFTPKLMNVKLTDADGNEVTTAMENGKLLMTQCTALYLIPTEIDVTVPDPASTNVSIDLIRTGDRLDAAVFAGDPTSIALPAISKENLRTAYILAVFCDPVYGQNGPTTKATHQGILPGTISFSLAFDKVEEP